MLRGLIVGLQLRREFAYWNEARNLDNGCYVMHVRGELKGPPNGEAFAD